MGFDVWVRLSELLPKIDIEGVVIQDENNNTWATVKKLDGDDLRAQADITRTYDLHHLKGDAHFAFLVHLWSIQQRQALLKSIHGPFHTKKEAALAALNLVLLS